MKTTTCFLFAALAVSSIVSSARAVNAEDYAHEDAFKHLVLSPDGQTIAYSQTIKGDHIVFLQNLNTGKKTGINLESSDKALYRDAAYFWSTSDRFVCQYGGRYYTMDTDGRNAKMTIPYGGLVHNFRDEKNGALLINGFEMSAGTGLGRMNQFVYLPRPFVHRVNTIEGASIGTGLATAGRSPILRVVDNPGKVLSWVATSEGEVLAGTEFKEDQFRVLYRESTKHENWMALPGLDWSDPSSSALGFSKDGNTLYVSRLSPEGTWALYPYDLNTRTLGKVMVGSPRYDLFHPFARGGTNGVSQNNLIYSPKEERLLGVRYNVDMPKTAWIDPEIAAVQESLDQALPGKINSIVSFSDDLQRMVLLSWSASDPGTFYLFDRQKVSLEKLMVGRPWVNPDESAEVKRFKFKNRDGLELSGYATLPPGKKPVGLPTLIIAGGSNRSLWDYDGFTQMFAAQGYMVLNVNHRTRAGLGDEFVKAGDKSLLLAAVNDIVDAVDWAVKVGLADPDRIAVRGYAGMSGLLALLSVQENPALFRCGFVNEPLVDLTKHVDHTRLTPWFYQQAVKMLGDPNTPEGMAKLKSASPALNGKAISIPMLVQHKDDIFGAEWVYSLTRDWAHAAGTNVTFIHDYDEKFGYQTLAKYWQEDLDFLQQHMPAD
ncbi:MAG: prolyl oligopeptidase family serine peptidase [Opitutaceae bacterium]|nr:prolyl oligopeptidase family serine peptidase [Opitutaceae bacterium]